MDCGECSEGRIGRRDEVADRPSLSAPPTSRTSVRHGPGPRGPESNWALCLDIFAPGTAITSAWNSSDTATHPANGTSMASPHVAGAAALHMDVHREATQQRVRDALVDNVTSGALTDIKPGSPNTLLTTSYLVSETLDIPQPHPTGEA